MTSPKDAATREPSKVPKGSAHKKIQTKKGRQLKISKPKSILRALSVLEAEKIF
jgi:hypothetical protein